MSNLFRCSFCGKIQDEVELLITGPEVFICDGCVELCNEIIAQERALRRERQALQSEQEFREVEE